MAVAAAAAEHEAGGSFRGRYRGCGAIYLNTYDAQHAGQAAVHVTLSNVCFDFVAKS